MYIFGFVCVLFKQTLILNKITTSLIGILAVQVLAGCIAGWSEAFEWIEMILGWVVSVFAFGVSAIELTNEMYQREVVNMHPWTPHSPDEVFGAAGRTNTLQSKAIKMRSAHAARGSNAVAAPASIRDLRSLTPPSSS